MPQLSIETFFSQYFWLVVIFFTLYYIMITILIPMISTALKIRNINTSVQKTHYSDPTLELRIAYSTINKTTHNSKFSNSFTNWYNKF